MPLNADGLPIVGTPPTATPPAQTNVNADGLPIVDGNAPSRSTPLPPSTNADGLPIVGSATPPSASGGVSAPEDPNAPWYKKLWEGANTPVSESVFGLPEYRPGAGGVERGVEKFITGLTSPLSIGLGLLTFGEGSAIESAGASVLRDTLMAGSEGLDEAGLAAKTASSNQEIGQFRNAIKAANTAEQQGKSIFQAVSQTGMNYDRYKTLNLMLHDADLNAADDFVGGNLAERGMSKVFRALDATPAQAQKIAKGIETAFNFGFAAPQVYQAKKMFPAVLADWKEGNYDKANEDLTDALLSGGLGLLGARYTLAKAGEFLPAINEITRLAPTVEAQKVRGITALRDGDVEASVQRGKNIEEELNAEFNKPTYYGNLITSAVKNLRSIFESDDVKTARAKAKSLTFAALDAGLDDPEYVRQAGNAIYQRFGMDDKVRAFVPREGPSELSGLIKEGPEVGPDMLPRETVATNTSKLQREGHVGFTNEQSIAAQQPEAGGAFNPQTPGAQPFSTGVSRHPRLFDDLDSFVAKGEEGVTPKGKQQLLQLADSYHQIAEGLSPEETALVGHVREVNDENWTAAAKAGIIRDYVENYVQRIFGPNADKAVGQWLNEVRSGRFDLNATQAMHRVYNSAFEGLMRGHELMVDDPVQLAGFGAENLGTIAANVNWFKAIRAAGIRGSDGLPAVILRGSGDTLAPRNGGDPSVLVLPNQLQDIHIAANEVSNMTRSGLLERNLNNGSVRDVTRRVNPTNIGEWVQNLSQDIAKAENRNPNLLDQRGTQAQLNATHEFLTGYAHDTAEAIQDAIDNGTPIPRNLNVPGWVTTIAAKETPKPRELADLHAYIDRMRSYAQGNLTDGATADLLKRAANPPVPPLRNPVDAQIFASSNQADLNLEQALEQAKTPEVKAAMSRAAAIDKKYGAAMKYRQATGMWPGQGGGNAGEPSMISRGKVDLLDARMLAALRGKAEGQNSVLLWHNDGTGPHVQYTIHLAGMDTTKAVGWLNKADVKGATIEEHPDGVFVHIIDTDPNSKAGQARLEKIHEYFGQDPIDYSRGYGEHLYEHTQTAGPAGPKATYDSVLKEAAERRNAESRAARGRGIDDNPEGTAAGVTSLLPDNLRKFWSSQSFKAGDKWIQATDSFGARHVAQVREAANDLKYPQLKEHLNTLKGVQSGILGKEALKPINDAQEPQYVWHPQGYVTPPKALPGIHWATKAPDGTSVFVQGEIAMHPEYAPYLTNALGLDESPVRAKTGFGRVTGPLLGVGKEAKSVLLSLSPFHMMQELLRGVMLGVNPLKVHPVDSFTQGAIDRLNYVVNEAQSTLKDNPGSAGHTQALASAQAELSRVRKLRDMAIQGATFAMDRKSLSEHSEGLASHSKLLSKIPILGKTMDWYQDFLFNRYMPSLKADAGLRMYDKYAQAHPEWAPTQVARATAEHINNAFGGQNWRAMGRSAATQDWFQLFALAPDWLESEMRFAASTLRGGLGTKNFSRQQVLLMAAGMWGAARVLNTLNSGDPHMESPFGVVAKDKDGRDVVYSVRTMPTDILHMASDPEGFLKGRLSPLARTAQEAVSGQDVYGRKLPPGSLWVDIASNMAPIPAQAIGQTLSGVTPQVGNFGQVFKAAGGTANVYKTPAQTLAGQLASQRNEDGQMDQTKLNRAEAVSRFEDDIRSGRMTFAQLEDLKDFSTLPRDEVKKIQTNVKLTAGMDASTARMVSTVSRMQMSDALQVWQLATPAERVALAKTMIAKKKRYMSKQYADSTPDERAQDKTFLTVRKLFEPETAQQ